MANSRSVNEGLRPQSTGGLAVLPQRRERLAIVSTRDTMCGIAAYTAALERQLADLFDVVVFDLNQYLLRSPNARTRAEGDRHIDEICRRIAGFDAVNLQLEYGTLGRSAADITRRLRKLINAAPRLCVTFHTVKRATVFSAADFVKTLFAGRFRSAIDIRTEFVRNRELSFGVAAQLRRAQRRKPVSVIVHNARDRDELRCVQRLDRVFEHPLSFLSAAEIAAAQASASRKRFPQLASVAATCTLIGVFGFINTYKGFHTVIQALHYLPRTHHLLIFGAVHPNEIIPFQPINPIVASLMDASLATDRSPAAATTSLDLETYLDAFGKDEPSELINRIHFMGALGDADFLAGMAICDTVVFPYLEVGQSSSGPLSLAVEMGCRIIASRTLAFLDFAAYHPDRIEFFYIGNHLELAQHIAARPQRQAQSPAPRYNAETNKAIYLAANSAAHIAGFQATHTANAPAPRYAVGVDG